MKSGAGLTLCLALALSPATAQSLSLITAKPLVDAWRKCAMDKAQIFTRSGEAAETVAKVALYECKDQKSLVYEALMRVDLQRSATNVQQLESDIKDYLVSLIVQGRSQQQGRAHD